MDIDVDWCLTCQRHIEGSNPYCSPDCHPPPLVPQHEVPDHNLSVFSDDQLFIDPPTRKWSADDDAGIAAWAASIPPSAAPSEHDISSPPELPPIQPSHTRSKAYRAPPNLLNPPPRAAPPCLSLPKPLPAQSSHSSPILLAPSPLSSTSLSHSKNASLSKTSSKSAQSDSPVSTPSSSHYPSVPIFCPSRKSSILGDMYIHVRSWVSPSPALFVPVDLPHDQRKPIQVHKFDSKFFTLTTHPPPAKKPLACENYLARGRRPSELAYIDDPPSFRARRRKAS